MDTDRRPVLKRAAQRSVSGHTLHADTGDLALFVEANQKAGRITSRKK